MLPHRDVLHSHVAGIVRDTELAGAGCLIEVFESCGGGGARRSNKSALDARRRSDYLRKQESRIEISQEARELFVIVMVSERLNTPRTSARMLAEPVVRCLAEPVTPGRIPVVGSVSKS